MITRFLLTIIVLTSSTSIADRAITVVFGTSAHQFWTTGNGKYWIGCNLFNPSSLDQKITVTPYDAGTFGYNDLNTETSTLTPKVITLKPKESYLTYWQIINGVNSKDVPKALSIEVVGLQGHVTGNCYTGHNGTYIADFPINGGRPF